jgi:hypothetical protein
MNVPGSKSTTRSEMITIHQVLKSLRGLGSVLQQKISDSHIPVVLAWLWQDLRSLLNVVKLAPISEPRQDHRLHVGDLHIEQQRLNFLSHMEVKLLYRHPLLRAGASTKTLSRHCLVLWMNLLVLLLPIFAATSALLLTIPAARSVREIPGFPIVLMHRPTEQSLVETMKQSLDRSGRNLASRPSTTPQMLNTRPRIL